MKKLIMIMAVAVAAAMPIMAATETVGGYTWTYRISSNTAELYNGNNLAAISPSPTGDVTIPSTLGGKTVTSIGQYAFYGCSGLTSVTIPIGVTSMGWRAFANATAMNSVYFNGAPPFVAKHSVEAAINLSQTGFNLGESSRTSVSAGDWDVFAGCSSSAVGYYLSAYAAEWQAALDSDGRWQGLTMCKGGDSGSYGGLSGGGSVTGTGGVLYSRTGEGGNDVSQEMEKVQQEWYSRTEKHYPSEVFVGGEKWDKTKPLPYHFACGAVLNSTEGDMRLDLQNVTVPKDGIHADGDLAILLIGNNYVTGFISAEEATLANYSLLIFGLGSLVVRNDDWGSAIYGSDVSICAGVSLTIYQQDDSHTALKADGNYLSSAGGTLLISLSSVSINAPNKSGYGISASTVNILGALLMVNAKNRGIDAYQGTIVIDGSVVNILSDSSTAVHGFKTFVCSHSYLACASSDGHAIYSDQMHFDNSLVKFYSKNWPALVVDDVMFGEGDYYIASGSEKHSAVISDSISESVMNVAINGGNVQVCAPGEETVGINATHLRIEAGRFEIVDKVDVRKFLKYDAVVAASFTGVLALAFDELVSAAFGAEAILSAALMANFYSQVIVDAISNYKIEDIKGNAYVGIQCDTYTQNCGTVWCDLPTYGILCYRPVVTGGSYRGKFYSPDYSWTINGGHDPVSPVDSNGNTLKCDSYTVVGAKKYDKIAQSWNGILPSYYGTGSLYADEYGKLYFWVPETWNSTSGGGGSGGDSDGGVTPVSGNCDIGFYKGWTDSKEWSDSMFVTTTQGGTTPMTSITQGAKIYLCYGFSNLAGDFDMSGFVNRFTLSTGTTFEDNWSNDTLAAGLWGWGGESYSPAALQNLTPGTYTLTCTLDATNKLSETNEGNNTKSITFTIVAPKYDMGFYKGWTNGKAWEDSLFVTTTQGGTSPMTSISQGSKIYLYYGFMNLAGEFDMNGFVNRFTLSTGAAFEDNWSADTLYAGDWGWGGESWHPDTLQNLAIGTYTLTCTLDATGKLSETNEGNNTKSITFSIVASGSDSGSGGGSVTPTTAPSKEIVKQWTAKKAVILNGAMYDSAGNVAGVVQLKVAKPNVRKGTAKVSGYVMPIDGKKAILPTSTVNVSAIAPMNVTATARSLGALTVKIGDDGFSGRVGNYIICTANVGGNWTRTNAKVHVATSSLPDGTLKALLPNGEPVLAKGGKWAFNKGASVKLSKDKSKAEWDTSGGKSNLSSMKLTYTPKTGLFKGSFKVYALEAAKLKKYTANVTGVVVDGKGYGQATIKKPASGPWAVTVE